MAILETTAVNVRVVPETPGFGAVIEGIDGHQPLSSEEIASVKEAVLKYKVVFFRGQNLSPSEQVAFATQFGEVYINTSKYPNAYDEEGLAPVTIVPHFHADVMYRPVGPSFSVLLMRELPSVGGDTMWMDLVASYNDLSEPFRAFLETLTVVQGVRDYDLSDDQLAADFLKRKGKVLSREDIKELREELAPWEAPLVRVIPETGGKNYWVASPVTKSIKGLSKAESDTILDVLFRHQMQPKYAYRYKWGVGDIAFWDQRTTLHCGMSDYGDERRFGNRVSLVPNSPVGVNASA